MAEIGAVVFDLDGVLLQSEELWDDVRRELAAAAGRRWPATATRDMMGMSSPEWSRYLVEQVGLPGTPEEVNERVLDELLGRYRDELPWIDGAPEAVERMAALWPLGLASSSNRQIIDHALEIGGLTRHFAVTVSSEEVPRGKPAPDVYLETARKLAIAPARCAAIEDSSNGLRSAAAAGMRVIAVPNPAHPPDPDALSLAAVAIGSLAALTPVVAGGEREAGD
ncbi:MAG: HAD family hydrolase [Solirubrobacteraceae bacterium]|nr:MAG: HAD family hydrolase [Solirubrobacterales bacterium]